MASTYKGNKGNEDMSEDSWFADSKSKSKSENEKTDIESQSQSQSNIMSEEKSPTNEMPTNEMPTNEMPTNEMPVFKDIDKIRQDKQEQATLERLQSIVNEDNAKEPCYTQDYIKSLEKAHLKEKMDYLMNKTCCNKDDNCELLIDDLYTQLTNCQHIHGNDKKIHCFKIATKLSNLLDATRAGGIKIKNKKVKSKRRKTKGRKSKRRKTKRRKSKRRKTKRRKVKN
jgi:hypothetical protein